MTDLLAEGRPSLVDGAERALRDWLASGRYREGDRLPPEYELAQMLGVSRGTLRSALGRLEESADIVRRQGSGTFVGSVAVCFGLGERLEPYSSLTRRRGLGLTSAGLEIEQRAVGNQVAEALGIEPDARATTVSHTLVAGGAPVAVLFDVVHPDVTLPGDQALRASLTQGEMLLDALIALGVRVSFTRTRVTPALLSSRARTGRLLGIRRATAGLEFEELIFAGRDEPVAYSHQVFAPGQIDVMVTRSLDAPRPARVADELRARGERSGRPALS